MGFHDVRLNDAVEVDFGTRGAPEFSVSVVRNDAGQEERVARWSSPIREYGADFSRRKQVNIYDLLSFYIARQGATHSFRFKDWTDYATTSNGTTHLPAASGIVPNVTATDETIGTGDAATTAFQLAKTYISGGFTRGRTLEKPVDGTVLVAVDGVAQTEGVDYSVDYTTGTVTFNSPPGNLLDITAGCEFDVEVRFGDDTNLDVTIDSFATSQTSVSLVEVRGQVPNPEEAFHGGHFDHGTIGVNFLITLAQGRVHTFNPSTSGLSLTLPPEEDVEPGGPLFYLANQSAETVELLRDDASKIIDIPANTIVSLFLSEGAGVRNWIASEA